MVMRSSSKAGLPAGIAGRRPEGREPSDPRTILTSIGEAVYDWDLASDQLTWGRNAGEVLRLADMAPLATGRAFGLSVEPDSGANRHEAILEAARGTDRGHGLPYRARYALRLGDRLVTIEDSGRVFADETGAPVLAHGVIRVERTADGAAARSGAATRDRSALLGVLATDLAEAGRGKRPLTLVTGSLDGLAALNEECGDAVGDGALEETAQRIRSVMRRRDRLVRYGGNRFALVLLSCPTDHTQLAIERVLRAVEEEPFDTPLGPRRLRLRLGAANAPQHAADAPTLLRRAEEALGLAKASRERGFAIYDPSLGRTERRTSPGPDLIAALNERRVRFACQPVVDAVTRQPAFAEALLRLERPEGGVMLAGQAIPAIEAAGLIPLLDTRMLELVGDHLLAHPEQRLSFNISAVTLESPDWLGTLAGHLGARPGIASRLIVEVTETVAVRDPAATRGRLDAMKALGVAIAVDDFGAGHTSFRHLRNFPIDILKLDGAFVQNLARSSDDRFFVRTLIDLAHHLNIATVAEWVEDEATARLLAEWGVDYLQGHHCGEPEIVEDAEHPGRASGAA